MSGKRKHRTAVEMLQYLKGKTSSRDRHDLERELEKDPFEKEALEGLESISPGEATEDILLLHSRLKKRLARRRRITYYSVAASVASLLIIGTVFLQVYDFKPKTEEEIVNEKVQQESSEKKMLSDESVKVQREAETELQQVAPTDQAKETPMAERASKGASPMEDQEKSHEVSKVVEVADADMEITDDLEFAMEASPEAKVEAKIEADGYLMHEEAEEISEKVVAVEAAPSVSQYAAAPEETSAARSSKRRSKSSVPAAETSGMATSQDKAITSAGVQVEVQNLSVASDSILSGIIQNAEPVGGYDAIGQYVEDNFVYPTRFDTAKSETLVLEITISKRGKINEITALESPGPEFSEEVTRILLEGPEWNAARNTQGTTQDVVRLRFLFKR